MSCNALTSAASSILGSAVQLKVEEDSSDTLRGRCRRVGALYQQMNKASHEEIRFAAHLQAAVVLTCKGLRAARYQHAVDMCKKVGLSSVNLSDLENMPRYELVWFLSHGENYYVTEKARLDAERLERQKKDEEGARERQAHLMAKKLRQEEQRRLEEQCVQLEKGFAEHSLRLVDDLTREEYVGTTTGYDALTGEIKRRVAETRSKQITRQELDALVVQQRADLAAELSREEAAKKVTNAIAKT